MFGASGKVGREVVAVALTRGHEVVAFVHRHNPFADEAGEAWLRVITGDVSDPAAVSGAIAGSEAVISCLGSWGTKDKNVVSTGMRTIIPAMERAGVRRLVTVTGAGAQWSGDRPGLVERAGHCLLGLAAAKILRDGEEHLRLLAASSLDWTAVRSPVMRSAGPTGYRLTRRPPWPLATIPRAAVARCLVDLAGQAAQVEEADLVAQGNYRQQAPFIRRR